LSEQQVTKHRSDGSLFIPAPEFFVILHIFGKYSDGELHIL